jgi:branched-chain amino acid transport system permease protein
VKGVYFSILSIAFVEVVRLTLTNTMGATNSVLATPLPNPISIPHILTIDFTSRVHFYYLILAAMVFTLFVLHKIEFSRLGAIFRSIEQSELLADSIGINVMRYKVLALCICSFFAGLAGALFAPYVKIISPESFTVWGSMVLLILMIVGGMGSFWGPVVGGIVLTVLPEILPTGPIADRIIYGSVIVLALIFLPKGLISFPEIVRQQVSKLRGLA